MARFAHCCDATFLPAGSYAPDVGMSSGPVGLRSVDLPDSGASECLANYSTFT